MQVIKRDGRLDDFNSERIVKAITLAMSQTSGGVDLKLANSIADSIEKSVSNKKQVSVYEIQDLVENKLMASSRKDVARSYITYRYNRDVARKSKTKEIFLEIIEAKANDITRENANMNADTPAGMMMKFASETTKPFVDDFLLSPEAREAHKNGYIHIHEKHIGIKRRSEEHSGNILGGSVQSCMENDRTEYRKDHRYCSIRMHNS